MSDAIDRLMQTLSEVRPGGLLEGYTFVHAHLTNGVYVMEFFFGEEDRLTMNTANGDMREHIVQAVRVHREMLSYSPVKGFIG